MSGRISIEGIGHGDKVRLTGSAWDTFNPDDTYEVDDESFHRPVIYADSGAGEVVQWYIMAEPVEGVDFTVTKVVE